MVLVASSATNKKKSKSSGNDNNDERKKTFAAPSCVAAHAANFVLFLECCRAAWFDFPDSVAAMAFYGVYHREPANQWIHFFGVPLILWTLLIGAAHLVLTDRMVIDFLPGIPSHRLSWAFLWMILYNAFYWYMDVTGAVLFAPVIYGMYKTAIEWTARDQHLHRQRQAKENRGGNGDGADRHHWMGTGRLLRCALLVHALSWYVQIHPGHHMIEGAAPASLSNLGGALTAAPLFAFYEGVWWIGFRKEFQQRVLEQVAVYTRELCGQGANMRVCKSL